MPFETITNNVYTEPQIYVAPTLAQARKVKGPTTDPRVAAGGYPLLALLGINAAFDGATSYQWYSWDPTSTALELDTSVIKPTGLTTGRWLAFSCVCVRAPS